MPNSPRKVRSRSTVPLSSFLGCRDSSGRATPMTRRARRAMSSLAARICLRSAGDSGPLGPDTHRSSSTSGAPFTSTRRPPPSFSWTVVISLRPESKGISPVRGRLSDSWFRSSPSPGGGHHQRPPRWGPPRIPGPPPSTPAGVAAQGPRQQGVPPVAPGRDPQLPHRHPVLGQGAVLSEQMTLAQPGSLLRAASSRWPPGPPSAPPPGPARW